MGEPSTLPSELQGLADVSLADLSWADPSLGYKDTGFFPVPTDRPVPPIPVNDVRRLPKVDFWRRFAPAEQIAILAVRKQIAEASSGDLLSNQNLAKLALVFETLDLIPAYIELDHAETLDALGAFVEAGILVPERIGQIIA